MYKYYLRTSFYLNFFEDQLNLEGEMFQVIITKSFIRKYFSKVVDCKKFDLFQTKTLYAFN